MKKRFSKLSVLGLSAMMILGTGVTAFAANNEITDTRTFTISAKQGDTHSYDVYQILKGDLAGTAADGSDSGNKLSNIKAGQNAKGLDSETAVNNAVKDIVDTKSIKAVPVLLLKINWIAITELMLTLFCKMGFKIS